MTTHFNPPSLGSLDTTTGARQELEATSTTHGSVSPLKTCLLFPGKGSSNKQDNEVANRHSFHYPYPVDRISSHFLYLIT